MASQPFDRNPVSGRTDREGRLVDADPPLRRLQEEAGSALGRPLALPQLAAIARTAMRLGVPLSRSVIAASSTEDYDLWVRAVPDIDGVSLLIEGWQPRPASGPRLTVISGGRDAELANGAHGASETSLKVDPELRILSVENGLARLWHPNDAAGQPLTRLVQLLENGEGSMPLLRALGARQDFADQPAKLRSGSEQKVLLSGTALMDDHGRFEGFDIRFDFGEADADAVDSGSDPALDDALRSPLDQIIAAADRIVDRSDGPLRSDYAAYASDIAAAGRHLLSVLRSMSEEPGTAADRVDLFALAQEAVSLVTADAAEAGVEFEVEEHEGPLDARGEPRAILQVLINILGNAVRHSPQGGTVAIVFEEDEGKAQVTVADMGPGIDRRDQQRIFERYEQGAAPGTAGLGLAISRRLARSMGGDVTLESAPGEGARFTLTLPRS